MIHPTAIVDPRAEIDRDASVGAYAMIEGPVKIGAGTTVHAHAHVCGWTTVGRDCEIHPFAVVGNAPQDYRYDGAESYVVIGDKTLIREHASIHRGHQGGGTTSIGRDCMIMAKAHVGHDCIIGDGVVLTNGAECAGHVEIGDRALVSAHVLIHQFVRIGRRAMCPGAARIKRDVPPFMATDFRGGVAKINSIGLQREGFSRQTILEIKSAYRRLYRSDQPFRQALDELRQQSHGPQVQELLDFLAAPSKRGTAGPSLAAAKD